MTRSVSELLAAEAALDHSFAVSVLAAMAAAGWPAYLHATGQPAPPWGGGWLRPALQGALLLAYCWFAAAVGRAARCLGRRHGPAVAWILTAPVLSLMPGPVASLAIAAAPLSLKLLLSGALRARIHDRILAE